MWLFFALGLVAKWSYAWRGWLIVASGFITYAVFNAAELFVRRSAGEFDDNLVFKHAGMFLMIGFEAVPLLVASLFVFVSRHEFSSRLRPR